MREVVSEDLVVLGAGAVSDPQFTNSDPKIALCNFPEQLVTCSCTTDDDELVGFGFEEVSIRVPTFPRPPIADPGCRCAFKNFSDEKKQANVVTKAFCLEK